MAGRSNRGLNNLTQKVSRGTACNFVGLAAMMLRPSLPSYSVPLARLSELAAVVALGRGGQRGRAKRENRRFGVRHLRAQVTQQALAMVVARWGGPGGCPEAAARAGRPGGAVLGRFNDRFAAKRPKFEWSTETGFLSRFSAMCGWSVSLSEDVARRRRRRRHPCWVGLPIGGREHQS